MIKIALIIGLMFTIWRIYKWSKMGFPMDFSKLHSINFIISITGVLIATALIVLFGKSNPHFSWSLIGIAGIAGIFLAIIEAFSYDKKGMYS